METLAWVQNSDFSTWVRESDWAIFAFLIMHTMSMGFLVGTGFAMNLRVLGVASQVAPAQFARLFPVMIYSVVVAVFSGLLLVIGYPAKALTNPLFYIKMGLIISALLLSRRLAKQYFNDSSVERVRASSVTRALALLCIVLWSAALTSGKFLAYTNKVLLLY